jgi:CRISPR-associated endonuclease/helicase Cas3
LRKVTPDGDKKETNLTLLDGQKWVLPWRRNRLSRKAWRELTVNLSRQVVSVSVRDAPLPIPRTAVQKLGFQHCFYLGNPDYPDDESILRIAVVDQFDSLCGLHGSPIHNSYNLVYREDIGYRTVRK